jgi:hypothetical protein
MRDPLSKKSAEQSNRRENKRRKEGKEVKLETQLSELWEMEVGC